MIYIIILILLVISNRKTKKEEIPDIEKSPKVTVSIFPYRSRYLLTGAEYAFYKILKEKFI